MIDLNLSELILQFIGAALLVLATSLATFLLVRRSDGRSTDASPLLQLRKATTVIAHQRDRQGLIQALLDQTIRISRAEVAAVMLRSEEEATGEIYGLIDGRARVDEIRLPSRIVSGKTDSAHPDEERTSPAPYEPPTHLPPHYPDIQNSIGATIHGPDRVVGEIFLANKLGGFTRDDEDLVTIMANHVGNTYENHSLVDQLKRGYMETIEALVTAIEAKDAYTRGHSERVTKYAVAIAREMGLPPGQVEEIRVGAVLHDIGKIGVSEAIINKPGPLTDEEWRMMREHPRMATKIIDSFNRSRDILLMLYHHHESWDGRGYPSGLKGTDIPLSARIIKVADAFEAMTSNRPYQKQKTMSEALSELQEGTGKQFDPNVVAAFRQVILNSESSAASHQAEGK